MIKSEGTYAGRRILEIQVEENQGWGGRSKQRWMDDAHLDTREKTADRRGCRIKVRKGHDTNINLMQTV